MKKEYTDAVKAILARPLTGTGGGIPLTKGEVLMLFADGYAGDGPDLLDVRSQGYGDDDDWDGLTKEDVGGGDEDDDTENFYVADDWAPFELFPDEFWKNAPVETAQDGPGTYEVRYREIQEHVCHVRAESREDAREQFENDNSVDYMQPVDLPEKFFMAVTDKVYGEDGNRIEKHVKLDTGETARVIAENSVVGFGEIVEDDDDEQEGSEYAITISNREGDWDEKFESLAEAQAACGDPGFKGIDCYIYKLGDWGENEYVEHRLVTDDTLIITDNKGNVRSVTR